MYNCLLDYQLLSGGLALTKLSNSELFTQMFITASQVVIKNHSFEQFDLTRLQALTLANICRMPGISMGRLANLIGVSRSQIAGSTIFIARRKAINFSKNSVEF